MASVTWLLEDDVFGANQRALADAVRAAGHRVAHFSETRGTTGMPEGEGPVVFHGSLGFAAQIGRDDLLVPGAFCDVDAFRCSTWYPRAAAWLLHEDWQRTTVAALVADPRGVTADLNSPTEIFVRPDSPLKPFGGRVVKTEGLTLAALDHGFYYDELDLSVIVAPVRSVGREWRYVVAAGEVVAGSAYAANGRDAIADDPLGAPWQLAAMIAAKLDPPPDDVYVLDVCECDGALHLLELNPFGGADLYACDVHAIVDAVSRVAVRVA